jgi:ABC-type phosphonate transport system ATPase subunit
MGVVGDPRIVFLDEPTAGLDPRSRRTMWQIIRDLVAGGVTVFLTTQDQPFTPVMETLRGLLMGTPIGNRGLLAVAWSVGIGLASYLWAKRLFDRDPTPVQ